LLDPIANPLAHLATEVSPSTDPPAWLIFQAEAFLGWFPRQGAFADLNSAFDFWADSKDFFPGDRAAIFALVLKGLSA
jgi:hypothetical protein